MIDETYKIVKRAKELVPECDWITDMYVMRLLWVSDRLISVTGFSRKELIDKKVLDLVKEDKTEIQLKVEFMERMAKGHGTQTYVIKGKSKNLVIEFEYLFFDFDGGRFTSVKIITVDGKKLLNLQSTSTVEDQRLK